MYLCHRLHLHVSPVGIGAHFVFELDLYLLCMPKTRSIDFWFMAIAKRRNCLSINIQLEKDL